MTQNDNNQDIQNEQFICPITLQLFCDPVKAADGHFYERQAITTWISLHGTSPFTRQPLQVKDLISDDHFKHLVDQKRKESNDHIVTLPPLRKLTGYSNRVSPKNVIQQPEKNTSSKKRRCQIICVIIVSIIVITSIIIGIVFAIKNSQGKIKSLYSSSLTLNSLTFNRSTSNDQGKYFYYYQNISIVISNDGFYQFSSLSSIDMYGYLYQNLFNYTNIDTNLLISDDDSGSNSQFSFQIYLKSKSYILVPTTFYIKITGAFQIIVLGPSTVTF